MQELLSILLPLISFHLSEQQSSANWREARQLRTIDYHRTNFEVVKKPDCA